MEFASNTAHDGADQNDKQTSLHCTASVCFANMC